MITSIVLFVLAVCIGLLYGRRYASEEHRKGNMSSVLVSSIGPFCTCVFLFVMLAVVLVIPPTLISGTTALAGRCKIYSLHHFDSTTGTFFLGCGTIGRTRYYVVFRQTDRGMRQTFYTTGSTYIQEGDDYEPYVEYYQSNTKHWVRMAFPLAWVCRGVRPEMEDYCVLYVPTGTVTQEFVLE